MLAFPAEPGSYAAGQELADRLADSVDAQNRRMVDAIKRGMRTLRMDGARKVMAGKTTPEEVLRVTQMDTF